MQGSAGERERRGGRWGKEKRRWAGIYANRQPFHRDWTGFSQTKRSWASERRSRSRAHHLFDPHVSFWIRASCHGPIFNHPPSFAPAPPPLLHSNRRWAKHRLLTEMVRNSCRIWPCLAEKRPKIYPGAVEIVRMHKTLARRSYGGLNSKRNTRPTGERKYEKMYNVQSITRNPPLSKDTTDAEKIRAPSALAGPVRDQSIILRINHGTGLYAGSE